MAFHFNRPRRIHHAELAVRVWDMQFARQRVTHARFDPQPLGASGLQPRKAFTPPKAEQRAADNGDDDATQPDSLGS